jgi:multicomponent Na+:H+ antiporter subunit D
MTTIYSPLPLYAVLAPLCGAVLILLTGSTRPNLREAWTLLAALAQCFFVYAMLSPVLQGSVIECSLVTIYRDTSFMFRVDAFGMVFALLSSFLWVIVSIYSIGYLRSIEEQAQTRYFSCFAMALCGAVGIALAGNLLTLFMFYEILTLATFPLVVHKETPEAMKAGQKYLIYLLTGAVFVLFSTGYVYCISGTMDFVAGGFLQGKASPQILKVILVCFMIGFGSKAALMPFHEWLPSAMVAPTPVSALLHAVAVVKAGVFCVLRVMLYVFGPALLKQLNVWLALAYIVSFTVIVANIFALTQDNLKRRLAFSTISSLAMIILGTCLLTADSARGAILYIPFHGFMKITLFMCSGAIFVKTKKKLVSELDGIGRQMPLTMAAFSIAAAGLVGIPPVCGLISKWYLCIGAYQSHETLFLFVFLVSALLDAAYLFPIVYSVFFKKPDSEQPLVSEAPLFIVIPSALTALFSVILCVFPGWLFAFFNLAGLVVTSMPWGG